MTMNKPNPTFLSLGEIAIGFNEYLALSVRLDGRFSLGRNHRIPAEGGDYPQYLKHAFIADTPNMLNIGWLIAKTLLEEFSPESAEWQGLESVITDIECVNPQGKEKRIEVSNTRELEFGFNRYTLIRRSPDGRYNWIQNTYAPTASKPLPVTLVRLTLPYETMMAVLWLIFYGLSSDMANALPQEYRAQLAKICSKIEEIHPAVVSSITEQ